MLDNFGYKLAVDLVELLLCLHYPSLYPHNTILLYDSCSDCSNSLSYASLWYRIFFKFWSLKYKKILSNQGNEFISCKKSCGICLGFSDSQQSKVDSFEKVFQLQLAFSFYIKIYQLKSNVLQSLLGRA